MLRSRATLRYVNLGMLLCPYLMTVMCTLSISLNLASLRRGRVLVIFEGTVLTHKVKMLVDTGSSVTLMNVKLYSTLLQDNGSSYALRPVKHILRAVDGTPLNVSGMVTVPMCVGGIHTSHTVIVANVGPDLLLGLDFLHDNGCTIDFATHSIVAGGKSVPMRSATFKGSAFICRVSLHEAVTVPSYSQVIVPGQVHCDSDIPTDVGWVSPCDRFLATHNIGMAGVIAKPDAKGFVPIRLQNFMPRPTTVRKGTMLGVYDTDITVDDASASDSATDDTCVTCSHVNVSAVKNAHEYFHLDHVSPCQLPKLATLLDNNADVISTSQFDLGKTTVTSHSIQPLTDDPIRCAPRRVPLHQQEEVRHHIQELLDHDIIAPSNSPWAAPIVIVRKPDKSIRLCVDYRRLNSVSKKDAFPLPRVDDAIDAVSGARYFSTIDLSSGYWQVELDSAAKAVSAFVSPFGLYEWNRMPFGLCNAPGTFQRLMNKVLGDLVPNICLVYLDDIIIFSNTFEDHLEHLSSVFNRLRVANLKIKPAKCHLLRTEVTYLGFNFSGAGVTPDSSKYAVVRDWPTPTSLSEVRSFVGFATYYRRFVPQFASIAAPLNRLSEKYAVFQWNDECEEAFQLLKAKLISPPTLAYPDVNRQFILDTDASNVAMGAVLSQVNELGEECVIAYASKALTKSQRKQGSTRKELLAVVTFTSYFRHYLLGAPFILRTDHKALIWLHSFRDTDGLLARWIERLAIFDYVVTHRPGKLHSNADALSRLLDENHSADTCTSTSSNTVNLVSTQCVGDSSQTLPVNSTWCEPFSLAELSAAQTDDSDISTIIGWQQALLDRPARSDVAMRGVSVRLLRLWSQWKRLVLIDNVLYRKYSFDEPGKSPILQLVVPQSLEDVVMKAVHSDASGGHLGVERSLDKLRKRYYWPFMTASVTNFCNSCDVCARRKSPVPANHAPLVQDQPSFPLERVAIDIMGPLPQSNRGNKYLVVVCDYFTKWAEAFPVPNIQAVTIATVLVDGFFCRYGVPYSLHSDRGAQFESKLFQLLCEMLDVRKTRTTAYRPQSDGLVERMNRTIENMLSAHVNEYHTNWDEHLQRCLLAYRSSIHSSTKETPAMLMFGRELILPVDLVFGTSQEQPLTVNEYVRKVRRSIQTAHTHARKAGAVAQRRQKALYDKRSRKPGIVVGDSVYLHSSVVTPGTSPKFHRPWTGPYVVVEFVDDVVVRIADGSGKMQTVHVDRLKHSKSAFVPVSPSETTESQPCRSLPRLPEPIVEYIVEPQQAPQVALPLGAVPAVHPVPQVYLLRNRQNLRRPVRYR